MSRLRVVVAGADGRLGRLAAAAVGGAADLELCGTLRRGDDPAAVLAACRPDVLVDLTVAAASVVLVGVAVERGVHPVIGTSGWPEAEARALARRCAERRLGALLVPNFSLGAVLQMRVAEQLAAHLTCTGIEEVHHPAKRDAPSGTARATAERIARAGGRAPPPIASERREGVLAEQTIRFAGPGETLSLSHAVDDRRAYLPGLLLAVRRVVTLSGLQVGLDGLLA